MKVEVQIFEKGFASCYNKNENWNELTSVDLSVGLENYPLVSCLMLTRGDPDLVSSAIHCFEYQTYPNRELVIVCDNITDALNLLVEMSSGPSVRIISVEPGHTLGSLRNIAVSNAKGEILCQWDDDDLYHRDRLNICISALLKTNVAAVFLKRWLIWWPESRVLAFSTDRLWEGSMVIHRNYIYSYPEIRKSEDTSMVEKLLTEYRIGLIDEPLIYCYTIHGNNTYDQSHFGEIISNAPVIFCYESAISRLSNAIPFVTHKMWKLIDKQKIDGRQDGIALLKFTGVNDLRCQLKSRISALETKTIEQQIRLEKILKDKESLCRFIPIALLKPMAEFLSTAGRATGSQSIERAAHRLWRYMD